MRIGIVSDVHNNAEGLQTALDRMGDVDDLLCAGDIVEEFRFRSEAVEILRDRGARCILGNHDLGLLSPHGERARSAAHIDPELLQFLAEQPRQIEITVDGKRLVMAHATPCAPGHPYVMRGSREYRALAKVDADYLVIGHTHTQMVERVGRPLVINPGSVGQARDASNGRKLSYAVLDTKSDDVWIDDYQVEA
jgi:putative phosphoesterase